MPFPPTPPPLSPESRTYLSECLESQWNQDSECLPTRAANEAAWKAQNEVRLMTGLPLLDGHELRWAFDTKLTRE